MTLIFLGKIRCTARFYTCLAFGTRVVVNSRLLFRGRIFDVPIICRKLPLRRLSFDVVGFGHGLCAKNRKSLGLISGRFSCNAVAETQTSFNTLLQHFVTEELFTCNIVTKALLFSCLWNTRAPRSLVVNKGTKSLIGVTLHASLSWRSDSTERQIDFIATKYSRQPSYAIHLPSWVLVFSAVTLETLTLYVKVVECLYLTLNRIFLVNT